MTHTADGRRWRRSRLCSSGACLEIAQEEGAFHIRDSKDPNGAVLTFTARQGEAFLTAVRAGAIH